uniref:Uncharacterized protein n=1 Tax=Oryza glaberrima TaxID=4538 RepID=I1R8Y2_ORYGL
MARPATMVASALLLVLLLIFSPTCGAKLFTDGHAYCVILCAAVGLLGRLGHVVQRIVVETGPAG